MWRFIHNRGGFPSNIWHPVYYEIDELCISLRSPASSFPWYQLCFCLQPPEIYPISRVYLIFSILHGLWLRVWVFVLFLVCLESIIHVTSLPWCTSLSGDEHCALPIVMFEMWFQSTSPSSGGILQLHIGAAPHFPSFTIWAQSTQCPNFRLHSFFSLMILFSVLLSRDEEKWDNCANKASFFVFIVLLWCFIMTCQLFNTPESCLWSTKWYNHIILKRLVSAFRLQRWLCCHARRKSTWSLGSKEL